MPCVMDAIEDLDYPADSAALASGNDSTSCTGALSFVVRGGRTTLR